MKKRSPVRISKETHLKLIILLIVLLAAVIIVTRCSGVRPVALRYDATRHPSAASYDSRPETRKAITSGLELPYYRNSSLVIRNRAGRYTLFYDTAYRQARWVAYLLTRGDVGRKGAKRRNAFRCDPEVVSRGWPTATDRDYAGSGFDRGHLLPSADRDDTPEENAATFCLSNVSPQRPGLNRRVWRDLEEQVRRWAAAYDSLYIVTGGELTPSLPRIRGGVGVPQRYYKAILGHFDGTWHAIAFLIPNSDDVQGRFTDYAVSVNELENALGMDFFPALPDDVEESVEQHWDRDVWE